MNSDKGKQAAVDSKEVLENLVNADGNTKMIFITAGMGGGTGTGAAPVIAEIAKKNEYTFTVDVIGRLSEMKRKNRYDPLNGCKIYYPDSLGAKS